MRERGDNREGSRADSVIISFGGTGAGNTDMSRF